MFEQEIKNLFLALGAEIIKELRLSAQLYSFKYGGGLPVFNQLTLRTGRLLNILRGSGARSRGGSIADIKEKIDGIHISWGANTPDIALHEFGGLRTITPAMRKFYWAKYFNDQNRRKMWLALALFKDVARYPARRPIGFAVKGAETAILKLISQYLANAVIIHQKIVAEKIK